MTELKIQIVNMKSQVLDFENSIRQQHDELENYKTENVDLNKQMTQFVMEKAGKSRDSVIVDLNQQVEKLQKQIEGIEKEKTEILGDKELYMTTQVQTFVFHENEENGQYLTRFNSACELFQEHFCPN
ncbi:uncharacterized protein LOC134697525 [Mytilus trossulus]|uniref:uncharacterized protein LOC134697525 n=1 Tax=Mytilus trossulus TaxID=6551 RepID=UPI003003AC1E